MYRRPASLVHNVLCHMQPGGRCGWLHRNCTTRYGAHQHPRLSCSTNLWGMAMPGPLSKLPMPELQRNAAPCMTTTWLQHAAVYVLHRCGCHVSINPSPRAYSCLHAGAALQQCTAPASDGMFALHGIYVRNGIYSRKCTTCSPVVSGAKAC
jgi:hypothetical protein